MSDAYLAGEEIAVLQHALKTTRAELGEAKRDKAVFLEAANKYKAQWEDVIVKHDKLRVELEQASKENTYLRAIAGKLSGTCLHCGLSDMSKCKSGFPGCAWADDLICADDEAARHIIAERDKLRAELAQSGEENSQLHYALKIERAEYAKLKLHASALATRLDALHRKTFNVSFDCEEVAAYHRDFPISEGSVEGHARRTQGESHVESAVLAGVESGPSETLSTQPVAAAAEREERALDALIAMALHPRSKEIQEGVARKLEEMQWHNPQAVPASALPPGHRFLRKDEMTVPVDARWWNGCAWRDYFGTIGERVNVITYCTATP